MSPDICTLNTLIFCVKNYSRRKKFIPNTFNNENISSGFWWDAGESSLQINGCMLHATYVLALTILWNNLISCGQNFRGLWFFCYSWGYTYNFIDAPIFSFSKKKTISFMSSFRRGCKFCKWLANSNKKKLSNHEFLWFHSTPFF